MSIEEILKAIEPFRTRQVLITGGEPLLQRQTPVLVRALSARNYQVSIETHGELSIEPVSQEARIIMDIKTPSSGMSRGRYRENLRFLKPNDEIKFVIASRGDYDWAKAIVLGDSLPTKEILFSVAMPTPKSPGTMGDLSPRWLAERILEDQLPVRFQIQLHRLIWGPDARGV